MNHEEKMEKQLKVIMVCAAGMSSSLLCSRISEAAAKKGLSMDISAIPSMTYKEISYEDISAVLVAPQVRGQKPEVESYIASLNLEIPVIQVGFQEYGLVKGDVVLEYLLENLNLNGKH